MQFTEIDIENIYKEEIFQKINEDKQIIDTKVLIKLKTEILNLNTRYKTIIKKRWLSKKKITLKELAKKYFVSKEYTEDANNGPAPPTEFNPELSAYDSESKTLSCVYTAFTRIENRHPTLINVGGY